MNDFIRYHFITRVQKIFPRIPSALTAADDVRSAMTKLENHIAAAEQIESDTNGTPDSNSNVEPSTIQ
jgi:hypothetical protein